MFTNKFIKNIALNSFPKKKVALIILSIIIFSFLHSEIGFMDFDGNNHSTHDYCNIINSASNQLHKDVKNLIIKLQIESNVGFPIIDDINLYKPTITNFNYQELKTTQTSSKIYLYNKTLLL